MALRSLSDAIEARLVLYRSTPTRRPIDVRGARQAVRLDGLTHGDSPAEPQALTLVFAEDAQSLVMLSIRAWPRDDVAGEVERIVGSFELASS